MNKIKEKENKTFESLKNKFNYKNRLAAPRLRKVVISVSTGSAVKKDPKRNDLVTDRIGKISGQKPALRAAKKSIAGFKIRQGDPVGLSVTLRGQRMYGFLDKFLNIALPRTKDFRGLNPKAVDDIGNMTVAIREHIIFPETADEDVKDVFGLAITIVTSARTRAEALEFFRHLGLPFRR
ncbi:50S ribosomal protein L5 [Candidatus Nomurabacteria bacterium RIFCSPHIGHO2_02_FULL_42_24]|uniref:Large ribosomal subunit protein uL5 n=1 Tax=Candidatus Nomurabacteria bacterium RIFCSPHIGHO2_02_FULL_42_24 TaxID=1801757 RepID=A0A1F6WH17_9BACT|nr:MAG: 50S ribosomal protein L5 [Parcubacteria group bacterium GW2011_GWA2_42_18]OGI81152.1 MAG: 50S ribosomal protein L5 [Candidatus Nomurabacteria bacterium RIFCSPHIGHO2_02_FULL_42_24]